jgi:flagellar basal-body rod modification protein FlgD
MATTSVAATGGVGSLGQDDFLKLLVTQLQHQDPLDPVKDTDFIAQLAQFSTLQGVQTLNASFDQVLKAQELSGGTDLMGKTVSYAADASAALQTGKVSGVQVQDGKVMLQVGGSTVPLDSVRSVSS